MKIISFANHKGGVGKTTSTLNVGAAIALKSRNVLLVDLDPQRSLTRSLLKNAPPNTILTVLTEQCLFKDAVFKAKDNLSLMPCDSTFVSFEKQFAKESDSRYVLSDFFNMLQKQYKDRFDYVLLDCPPAFSLITVNALVASHEVYVPMEAQQYSLEGLHQIAWEIDRIRKQDNKKLRLKGVFFSRHNPRTYISKDVVRYLEEKYPGLLLKTYIRQNIALRESPSIQKSIFEYAPKSKGAEDYMCLTEEIVKE